MHNANYLKHPKELKSDPLGLYPEVINFPYHRVLDFSRGMPLFILENTLVGTGYITLCLYKGHLMGWGVSSSTIYYDEDISYFLNKGMASIRCFYNEWKTGKCNFSYRRMTFETLKEGEWFCHCGMHYLKKGSQGLYKNWPEDFEPKTEVYQLKGLHYE